MKDINVVLRNKRIQMAELALEIDGLETAATALRPVVHLLGEDEPMPNIASRVSEDAPPTLVDEARGVAPERSRVRRWV